MRGALTALNECCAVSLCFMSTERFEHHRREDGELLGWIEERGDGFVAIDRFGYARTDVTDWFEVESALDELGLSYLAERYEFLREDGTRLNVRIAEVWEDSVVVKEDDGGAVGAPQIFYTLPIPVDRARLYPR